MCDLPNNEEALHTAQMQLLPSRQALTELMLWMDGVENTVNEDEGKTVTSLMDVQLLLQKYRVSTARRDIRMRRHWFCPPKIIEP